MATASSRYFRIVPVTVTVLAVATALWLARRSSETPRGGAPLRQVGITGLTMGPIEFQIQGLHASLAADQVDRALQNARNCLSRVNEVMSAYRPSSDLSRLNRAPAGKSVPLDGDLLSLLDRSRHWTPLTDGAFDPTARPLFELWKQAGKNQRLPTDDGIAAALKPTGWKHLTLDLEARTAVKAVEGFQIDLGAVAKGYAVDRALEQLRRAGFAGGLVEVGGEVRVFGAAPAGETWTIGIRDPFRPDELCGRLALRDAAAATSGNYFRFSEIDGHRYSHVLDPRTGWPADAAASVTVIAADCTTADVWATVLSVLGEKALAKIDAMDRVEAMMILGTATEYRVVASKGFGAYLVGGKLISPR